MFNKQIKEMQLNCIELVDSAADRILESTAISSLSFRVFFHFYWGRKPDGMSVVRGVRARQHLRPCPGATPL